MRRIRWKITKHFLPAPPSLCTGCHTSSLMAIISSALSGVKLNSELISLQPCSYILQHNIYPLESDSEFRLGMHHLGCAGHGRRLRQRIHLGSNTQRRARDTERLDLEWLLRFTKVGSSNVQWKYTETERERAIMNISDWRSQKWPSQPLMSGHSYLYRWFLNKLKICTEWCAPVLAESFTDAFRWDLIQIILFQHTRRSTASLTLTHWECWMIFGVWPDEPYTTHVYTRMVWKVKYLD